LQSIWVPRQVVVQDCIEAVLEVDTLAKTVRCHQHTVLSLWLGLDQVLYERPSLLIAATRSGYRNRTEILPLVAQASIQFIRHILCRRNEAAIDDWVEALLNQRQQEVGGFRDLRIVPRFKTFGTSGEFS